MKATKGETELVTCPDCGGGGKLPPARYTDGPLTCSRCDGTGKVPKEETDATDSDDEAGA